MKMLGNWEIWKLDEASRNRELCFAYLDAACCLAENLAQGSFSSSYSHATVIRGLEFHGVELFLKYAISRAGGTVNKDHYIRDLAEEYDNLYPEKEYRLDFLFITQYLGVEPEERERLILHESKKENRNRDDQMSRYHNDKDGKPWEGVYAFDPESYPHEIHARKNKLSRISEMIGSEKKM